MAIISDGVTKIFLAVLSSLYFPYAAQTKVISPVSQSMSFSVAYTTLQPGIFLTSSTLISALPAKFHISLEAYLVHYTPENFSFSEHLMQ
jgi:hypothetical protein